MTPSPAASPNLTRLLAALRAADIPYSGVTRTDIETVLLLDVDSFGDTVVIYEILVMAHDEPTEANRVPWLPGISRYAYRFVSGGYEDHARRQVTFDDPDSITNVITSDIAAHRSGKLLKRESPTDEEPLLYNEL
jgi:hypothetical protein